MQLYLFHVPRTKNGVPGVSMCVHSVPKEPRTESLDLARPPARRLAATPHRTDGDTDPHGPTRTRANARDGSWMELMDGAAELTWMEPWPHRTLEDATCDVGHVGEECSTSTSTRLRDFSIELPCL